MEIYNNIHGEEKMSQTSRIDLILIGTDFVNLVEFCKIKPAVIQSTDHQSVFLKFNPGLTEKGNGYWKINNSISKEEEYKKIINNLIDRYLNTKKTIDIRLLWDALKIEIREITSVYCKNKANYCKGYNPRQSAD